MPDTRRPTLSQPWRVTLVRLGLAAALILALFASDWAAMARQWWDISTYNHILLVPAILAWLVWQRRSELAKLTPEPWWPGLVLVAGASFLWLLGAFSGLDLARQAGVVALSAAMVPLLAGPKVTAGLLFPLFYMVFLVPCGEELVTVLQTVTAHITIALVHLSGIPAQVDGVFIDTPAGLFEVAEACSGVKFLVAMMAFGALMANACFVRPSRRTWLMLACVVVPILANGVRAWGTIYAAQIFGVEAAAGFDHIVYGWFFFAFVIALIVALAWRFFDRAVDDPMIDAEAIDRPPLLARLSTMRLAPAQALLAALAIVLGAQGWAHAANSIRATLPPAIDLPTVPGWTRVDYRPRIWWQPRAGGADHRLLGSYADAHGRRVDVFYALYASQTEGHEAGGFGQGALVPQSEWAWQANATPLAGSHGERLLGAGRVPRVAQTWYRNGTILTGSNARLKLAAMSDRLALRAQPTMVLIVSAEDHAGKPAEPAIQAFVQAAGPLGPWMDRIGGVK
ncbi:exosortase A [Novosphingobium chloroacetimidivorans]|uniref:Exosortase A n=1 Tax=Novosphingobium chloroacetimidivorans TaxID=1428314 RepID=A0A7W7K9L9_9SPHN|nr:exosortase A [Novosphingobium chloroacetimidivorans]MBB4858525.1 exosortase A [Novosphingobium chloroacetimidivorans]